MITIFFGVLALIAMFCLAIYLIVQGIAGMYKRSLIRRYGVLTKGRIVERKSRSREPGSVYYSYEHENRVYTAEQRVSYSHMDRLNINASVQIRYLPYHPAVALLAGEDEDNAWTVLPVAVGSLLLAILLFGGIMMLVLIA